jgi:hypothetical protein
LREAAIAADDVRVTPAGFRRIALGLKDAIEHAHHGHPDFRVGGRVFASLGYPDAKWGAVMLTPEQQRTFVRGDPQAFVPAAGAWGAQGSTTVRLQAVDEEALGEALTLAWRTSFHKGPTRTVAARKNKKK